MTNKLYTANLTLLNTSNETSKHEPICPASKETQHKPSPTHHNTTTPQAPQPRNTPPNPHTTPIQQDQQNPTYPIQQQPPPSHRILHSCICLIGESPPTTFTIAQCTASPNDPHINPRRRDGEALAKCLP
ncbi:hypothetical protein J1614_011273 [Plenodomus biglobosus]|nr:hypothetical protein J1614_011273 [Plenodomus biglobosus]